MKGIGELIELLNDYIPEGWSIEHGGKSIFYEGLRYNDRIISKDFGFIKWLVDNDKIDRLTFCTVETPSAKYEDFDLGPETPREDYTNILLMDLAIQEKPIEFLISILRER